jgi:hypothetical protein
LASRSAELLAPLEHLAEEREIEAGGPPLAIFRSAEILERYVVPSHQAEALTIASHFYLLPFVATVFAPQDFFILELNTKRLRLLRYTYGKCAELALPAAIPPGLEAAGGFDQPDHTLMNRSFAGPSVGTMPGVRFGTLSDREAAGEYLHHFFELVDRGLTETLGGKPLLLAGVHEEIAAYRRVARYEHILTPELAGNPQHLSFAQIAARAAEMALAHHQMAGERWLADFREMPDRGRTADDVRQVLGAAAQGRVHRLCVRDQTKVIGPMEPELDSAHLGREDLINAAAVETLRTGGEVFVLPQDRVPVTHPLAAILRY